MLPLAPFVHAPRDYVTPLQINRSSEDYRLEETRPGESASGDHARASWREPRRETVDLIASLISRSLVGHLAPKWSWQETQKGEDVAQYRWAPDNAIRMGQAIHDVLGDLIHPGGERGFFGSGSHLRADVARSQDL
jgi:hypothetical protein